MSATFLKIKNKGVSLVETILYMALMVLVVTVVVQILVSMGGIYRELKLSREVESAGVVSMERMLREIRNASSVVVAESNFVSSPGTLKISGIDESLNPYSLTFDVSSGLVQIKEGNGLPEAITSSSAQISYLLFTHVTNENSEAVRIEMEVSASAGAVSKSKKFYGFSVLRGSY